MIAAYSEPPLSHPYDPTDPSCRQEYGGSIKKVIRPRFE